MQHLKLTRICKIFDQDSGKQFVKKAIVTFKIYFVLQVTADIMKRHYRKYAVQKPGQTGTSINPNHSHFLFVDDSVMGVPAKGAELQLRERFEKYVSVTAGKHSWENTQKYEVKGRESSFYWIQ